MSTPKIKEENFQLVKRALESSGITNRFAVNAILATVWKESNFSPRDENLNYSKERLPEVWSRFSKTGKAVPQGQGKYNYNDLAVKLEHDPPALAEEVYGGQYGNTAPGDGYKYRGRGFNGITFKSQYKLYGDLLKLDLIKEPELLNVPVNAARANALYFLRAFKDGRDIVQANYGAKDINDFKDQQTALRAMTHANAGWRAKQWVRDWAYGKAAEFMPYVEERTGKGSPGANIVPFITALAIFWGLSKLL